LKTKRRILTLLFVSLALWIGWASWNLATYDFWEATLIGPFQGTVYQGELPPKPTSVLDLSRGAQLELYEIPGASVPVLALRRDAKIEWRQFLLPERRSPDGKVTTAAIRDARFRHRVASFSRGTKVKFTCDWDWGGPEAGLIYLKPDQTLDHFGISW
jgi:hypothetical protein